MAPSTHREAALTLVPPQRMAMMLDHVTVHRGGRTILRDIGFTLPEGAILAVVGPSGAGKTTLLGVLNGLITPGCGRVDVGDIGQLDNPARLREHQRQTATVFQEHALIDRLSALDNVLLGLADRRHPLSLLPWRQTDRRNAVMVLDHVGLLACAHRRVGRLSGGERQRVGFARALVRRPTLLLADEPFAAVDPMLVRHLCDTLRHAVITEGVTLVIVLHQIEIARALADQIIGLRDGRIRFIGSPHDFDAAAEAQVFHPLSINQKRNGVLDA